MGTRSKGGYKDPVNSKLRDETRSKERPPKKLVVSRYRTRTRRYRKVR